MLRAAMLGARLSSLTMNALIRSGPSTYIQKKNFSSLQSATKIDIKSQDFFKSVGFEDRARSLIFGEKKYTDFTPEERKIVDYYQEKMLQEDFVILPNTSAALEQAEIEQLLLERSKE